MPIPVLHFDNPTDGLPRVPIPLRLACHVVQWSPAQLLEVLAQAVPSVELPGYALEHGAARTVSVQRYGRLRAKVAQAVADQAATSLLPANHFVWSDDLVKAHSAFIDVAWDRESAVAAGAGVNWNPAIEEDTASVAECPDFSHLAIADRGQQLTRREQGKRKTEERHHSWKTRRAELAAANPGKPDHWIARQIAKDPTISDGRAAETIRKIMRQN